MACSDNYQIIGTGNVLINLRNINYLISQLARQSFNLVKGVDHKDPSDPCEHGKNQCKIDVDELAKFVIYIL